MLTHLGRKTSTLVQHRATEFRTIASHRECWECFGIAARHAKAGRYLSIDCFQAVGRVALTHAIRGGEAKGSSFEVAPPTNLTIKILVGSLPWSR